MRYLYHFEFCERPEMPEWLRGDLFSTLGFLQTVFGLEETLTRAVPELIVASGARQVIELGSGSGEGLALVAGSLPGVKVQATDKFPHPESWQQLLGAFKNASWNERPVSFEDFDRMVGAKALDGSVILLTSAFHHVRDADAKDFLARAAASRASVLVVEGLERSVWGALMGGLVSVPALVSPLRALFGKGPRVGLGPWLRSAFFHWIVPLIPFFLMHDGVVSAFRQRTQPDWVRLTQGLPFELKVRQNLGFLGNFSATLLRYSA